MRRLITVWVAAVLSCSCLGSSVLAAPVTLPFAAGGWQYEVKIDDSYLPYGVTPTRIVIRLCLPTMRACGPRTKAAGETSFSIQVTQDGLWFQREEESASTKWLQRIDPARLQLAEYLANGEIVYSGDASGCERAASGASCDVVIRPPDDSPCARGEVSQFRIADRCRVINCSAIHLNGYHGGLCSYWSSHLGLPVSLTFLYADAPAVLSNLTPISRFIDEHVHRK
jgi:hypothetical protein